MVCVLLPASNAVGFVWNNPYPASESNKAIYYTTYAEQPKNLDPAIAYNANEYQFIGQIYEPALQYDYLKRPYTLIPLTAEALPEITYYDKEGKVLRQSSSGVVAKSVYTLHIKPGIVYQPHPALAKTADQQNEYLNLEANYLEKNNIHRLADFQHTGTRELVADDYVYEIKRLASPRVNSSIYGMMGEHIMGFLDYAASLPTEAQHPGFLDLRAYPLSGVRLVDRYTYEITLTGEYPQFLFWLAMPFFAPLPWEADAFYAQPGMVNRNISLAWYPIGTGAFMMTENNPNSRIVLTKNPSFREEYFPSMGTEEDRAAGYLQHAGERIPMIDSVVFVLEKESIPRWSKFLQGYYDLSGVAADSFDQAIDVNAAGELTLTASMRDKGIHLQERVEPTVSYLGFNMLDPIVGGRSERARKLRQAIAIAVDYDENISIFFNGRGEAAQGPIPPGVFGYREGVKGVNPFVYRWERGQKKRRSIEEARALLSAAGYPNGIDPKTHQALTLHYDVPSMGGPDEKAVLNWMTKEFNALGINLDIRATQANRFQEKMRNGNAQIFSWGWSADYPDPENFLFLLLGANGKVQYGGENATNYHNALYDVLFHKMKNRSNDEQRLALIDQMLAILHYDTPWAGGIHSKTPVLRQQWFSPVKPNSLSQNTLKYVAIDVPQRKALRAQWNQAILWPAVFFMMGVMMMIMPFLLVYRRQQSRAVKRISRR